MSAASDTRTKISARLQQIKPLHWAIIFVVAILLLVLLTPHLIGYAIRYAAQNQGYVLTYRETKLTPTKGRLEYRDLEVITNNQTLFSCEHCMVTIDIDETFDDRYVIREALVSNARFNYEALPRSNEQTETEIPYWQIDQLNITNLQLNHLPKLKQPTLRVNELAIENLNRDSVKPGFIKLDLGYETSGLTLAGKVMTSPHLDFDSLDISLRRFNVEWIPAEYRILQFDLSGIMDLEAKLGWGAKDTDTRELIVHNLEYKVDNGAIIQEKSGIHTLHGSFAGNGKLLINTKEMPERLIYEQVSYDAKISLSGNITDGVTADRPIQLEGMQVNISSDIGHGENRETRITSKIQIPSMNHVLPDNIRISGSSFWDGNTVLKFQSSRPNFSATHTGKMTGSIDLQADPSRGIPNIKLANLDFTGELSQSRTDDEPLVFTIKGDTAAESLVATHLPGRPDSRLQLEKTELKNLVAGTFPISLNIEHLSSNSLVLNEIDHEQGLPIKDVQLESLSYQDNELAIQSLSLGHIGINIQKPESGDIQVIPGALFSANDADHPKQEQNTEDQLKIYIESLNIGKDSFIKFTDHSVKPEFQTQLLLSSVTINHLSTDGGQPTSFEAKGKVGKRGKFNLEGNFAQADDKIDVEAASKLTALSLKQYSPYTDKIIGYEMNKGHVDLKIHGSIKSNQLDGKSELLITGLKVTPLNNDIQKQFDESIGLSLPSAISMLEDNKGHIDLTVPISGDIDNPDFGMDDVISKALDEGLKAGLLVAFQPLGLAVIAVDAISKLGGIPLGEIDFEPGSADVDSVDAERLVLLAEKMLEKPGTRLKVCAQALENELPPGSLLNKSRQAQPEKAPDQQTAKTLDPEFTRGLAKQRLMVIRNFLIEHKVGENRFEECTPEVVSAENNKPSVKLVLVDSATGGDKPPPVTKQEAAD